MKGALVALCLDLTIRERTRSRHSLDDVMRLMWQRWGKDFYTARQTTGHGLPEDGFPAIVEEATGLKIPVDQAGADYLVLLSSMEIVNYPEYIEAIAKIFHKAGISYTLSSEAYEATNAGIQIGNSDLAKVIVSSLVAAMTRTGTLLVPRPRLSPPFLTPPLKKASST